MARAYLIGEEDAVEDESNDGESDADFGEESEAYTVSTRSIAAMSISAKNAQFVVDAAFLDTACSKLSLVEKQHIAATEVSSLREIAPVMGNQKSIEGIGGSVPTIGTMMFYFLFGGREYAVKLNIVLNRFPLSISQIDLDKMGLNYQALYKIGERLGDGFVEKVEIRNGLPFLVPSSCCYQTMAQLKIIHRNLGHLSLDKQIR